MRIILCHLQQHPLTELLNLSVPHAALHQIVARHDPRQAARASI
jgi:hypothetical protein